MQTTLAAIAVVTVGYILAYLLFDRLRDRYGYVGGAEYVIIGFLLGPQVSGLLNAGQVQDLTPIVSLALGWLGMLLGTYFRLPAMALIEGDHLRIAFAEAVVRTIPPSSRWAAWMDAARPRKRSGSSIRPCGSRRRPRMPTRWRLPRR